jgi:peroxiredoxin
MLKPTIVFPAVIGVMTAFLVFHKIAGNLKALSPQDTSVTSSSLPRGKLINLQTNQDDYEQLKKGKVLLVFLTRGCAACQKEIPNINQALPSLLPRMAIYGVYLEERNQLDAFVQENKIEFPILLDEGGRVFGRLGITLIPAKVLMENGTITKTWFGSSPNKSTLIRDVGELEIQ